MTPVYLTVSNMNDHQVLQSDLESLRHWERTWDIGARYSILHAQKVRIYGCSKVPGHDHQQEPELEQPYKQYYQQC